ncbi:MAG: SDR family oxidoreductase [Firmicutes bacterium]|jgi:dihydroflavonol-4-reductase|nr:SDR family oxidoreductase [Bacillota bacterium]
MIVVTGATGHIGNVLVRELEARGQGVRALVLPSEDTRPLAGLRVEKVPGNLLDPASLAQAFRGAEVVYHLAGIVSILPGKRDPVRRVNVEGTYNVIEACLRAGVRRLVYTSSIHALVEPPHGTVIDETCGFDPQRARGHYDRSKAEASLAVLRAAEEGLDSVIICPTGVIGPYDFRVSVMGRLILDIAGRRVRVVPDGAYDFVDVRDVATGHIQACEKGKTGEVYILSGARVTVCGLVRMVEEAVGERLPYLALPAWVASLAAELAPAYYALTHKEPRFTRYSIQTLRSNSYVTCAKAHRELGYSPRPLNESVRDTVRWFQENAEHCLSGKPLLVGPIAKRVGPA